MSAQQPGQTRKEQKAATRIDLLAAARRTFMSTGVAKTGVGDVAKAAGVAHGTFYVHFENKDAVVREVGPSFISIYDTQWNEIDTIQFNDGGVGFGGVAPVSPTQLAAECEEIFWGPRQPTRAAQLGQHGTLYIWVPPGSGCHLVRERELLTQLWLYDELFPG